LATRQLLPRQPAVALLAAALMAFNPMVLFMSGVVQNSTAALAASAAVLYALSRWLRQGFSLTRWAWLGALFSAAVLTQTSSLALAAPIALGLAYDAAGWGDPSPTPRAQRLRRLMAGALAFGLPVVVLTGWWFVRNQILYGDWTGNSIVGALWADQPIMPFEQVWHLLATGMVGRFGFGLIVEYSDAIYRVVWLLTLVAALGLARLALSSLAQPRRLRLNEEAVLWGAHVATVSVVSLALGAYILWYIRGGHGRYMFTAYPSLAILLAAGGLAWFRAPQHRLAPIVGAGLSLSLSAYGLFGLVIPTYAPPPVPTSRELGQMTPLDAQIGKVARVLGYTLRPARVRPGEALKVEVYWLPEARTETPYTVFIHLLQPGAGSIAQQDTYPGRGNWATTVWDPGRAFVDVYQLKLPQDTPAFDHGILVLGLYDANTMQRLPVTGADAGSTGEAWVQFGNIQVKP
ncbi:MAG: hypothetical protein ACRDH2_12270, partial [Anaerolineales bacterium]